MATRKKTTKKTTARYLKSSDVASIEKNIKSAIIACTKFIDKKETIVGIDGTDAKPAIKKIRKNLIDINNFYGWNVHPKN